MCYNTFYTSFSYSLLGDVVWIWSHQAEKCVCKKEFTEIELSMKPMTSKQNSDNTSKIKRCNKAISLDCEDVYYSLLSHHLHTHRICEVSYMCHSGNLKIQIYAVGNEDL